MYNLKECAKARGALNELLIHKKYDEYTSHYAFNLDESSKIFELNEIYEKMAIENCPPISNDELFENPINTCNYFKESLNVNTELFKIDKNQIFKDKIKELKEITDSVC